MYIWIYSYSNIKKYIKILNKKNTGAKYAPVKIPFYDVDISLLLLYNKDWSY